MLKERLGLDLDLQVRLDILANMELLVQLAAIQVAIELFWAVVMLSAMKSLLLE